MFICTPRPLFEDFELVILYLAATLYRKNVHQTNQLNQLPNTISLKKIYYACTQTRFYQCMMACWKQGSSPNNKVTLIELFGEIVISRQFVEKSLLSGHKRKFYIQFLSSEA